MSGNRSMPSAAIIPENFLIPTCVRQWAGYAAHLDLQSGCGSRTIAPSFLMEKGPLKLGWYTLRGLNYFHRDLCALF